MSATFWLIYNNEHGRLPTMEYIKSGTMEDKIWINKQTGDLIIRKLTLKDDGFYKCQLGSQHTVIRLQVQRT